MYFIKKHKKWIRTENESASSPIMGFGGLMTCNQRTNTVGAKSDQLVNICRFAIRCDWIWPSTQ